jgi:hypothetical protein
MTQTTMPPRIRPIEPPYDPDTEAQLLKWMPPNSPMEPLVLFRTLLVRHASPRGCARSGQGSWVLG